MKRRTTLASLLLAMAGAFAPQMVSAAEDWKMHIVWVPSRPEAVSMKEFAAKAGELSQGTLDITVFDSGSLGIKDPDMLRVLPPGTTIQAAGLSPSYLARDVPELPFALPVGVIGDPDDAPKLLPTLDTIYRDVYERNGVKLLGLVTSPVKGTQIFCKDPVNSLEELKSRKVRVWGKFQVDVFNALGIPAQIIPQGDLYLALQTGVVDCAVYAAAFARSISLQEVARNMAYLHPYTEAPLGVIVSQRAFDALPEEAQKALVEAGEWITARTAEAYLAGSQIDDEAEEFLKSAGVNVMPAFSEADQAAYVETSRRFWKEASESLGERGIANYEVINAALAAE